jgi:hypothetical protein
LTLDLAIVLLFIAFFAFSVCVSITAIGKERPPLKPSAVVAVVIIDALMAVGVLHLYWT